MSADKLNGSHFKVRRSRIIFSNVAILLGLVSTITPTSALTHLFTDGNVHVSWRVSNSGDQPGGNNEGKGQSGNSNDVPEHFPENVEFCEYGEHELDESMPGVVVKRVSTDTVIDYIKACRTFISQEAALRRKHRRLTRRKRDIDYDFQVIYPGTKYCGAGNISSGYDDLGRRKEVDMCCREHDYCPDFIRNGQEQGGLRNDRGYTMLSCACDETFRKCLYRINDFHANTIGFTYFNILGNECYAPVTNSVINGVQLQLYASRPYVPCFESGFFGRIFNNRDC